MMKFKKWILSLLIACLCTLGLGVFAACGEPSYYHLYFESANGFHYDIGMKLPSGESFISGGEVKSGYTVKFAVVLEAGATGEPVVYANNEQLTADGDGIYSFKMKEETTVSVTGVTASANDRAVIFDNGGNHVWFYDAEGNELTRLEDVDDGEEIAFSVKISVYYKAHETGDFMVVANSDLLEPDDDGLYHLTVHGGTTVAVRERDAEGSVTGTLAVGENFTEREDGGNGSATNPFRISTPADLFMMSILVNGQDYTGYNTANYELVNDIDLEGDQLYVIGDVSSSSAIFGGTFNGNGHTISNYKITSSYISTEDGLERILTNVGVFGLAMPVVNQVPEIYNLRLEDFVIDADCSGAAGSVVSVGGLVGYGIGVRITGCSVNGELTATASSDGTFGYAGGVIGLLQSAYDANTQTSSFASVVSCDTDVTVIGLNYVMAAGGIAGAVISYEPNTTAFILNSYATGDVSGAIRAGGVAGCVFQYASVLSSYATGRVEAVTRFADDYQSPEFAHSYAGGVVGYAENDVIISDSFSASLTFAEASTGTSYAHTGDVLGGKLADADIPGYDAAPALVRNSVHTKDVQVTDDYIKNTLGWDEEDWVFGSGYPTVNHEETSKTFTITLNFGDKQVDGASTKEYTVSTYISMSYWYLFMQGADRLPQFVDADDGTRSYGYFFDAAHSEKVPSAYVPTVDVTLYAAFANYKDIAGTYYLRGVGNREKGVSLTLGANGTLTYRNGAMTNTSYYYYDGQKATLVNTILGIHGSTSEGQSVNYANFRATPGEHGILTIDDKTYYSSAALTAQKEFGNFFYGVYNMANASYAFYKDGTGTRTPTSGSPTEFTYYVDGTAIHITQTDGNTRQGVVGSDGHIVSIGNDSNPTVLDEFMGTWERSANAHEEYTFDGKGGFTYTYYDYTGNVRHEVTTESGTYQLVTTGPDNYLSFTVSGKEYHAYFENGFLTVEKMEGGAKVVCYRAGSYTGTWVFKNSREQIRLTLGGIGESGVGNASVSYIGQSTGSYEITYEATANGILLYLNDLHFGTLTFNVGSRTLTGEFYSNRESALRLNTTFILYDELRGEWISSQDGFDLVEFNGEGSYELAGNANYLAVRGTISIGGKAVGYYKLENGTMKGTFTYQNVQYTIEYSEAEGCIHVTSAQGSFDLEKHDMWYGLELVDEKGRTYSFDGRGALEGGGKITSFSESYSTYQYTVQDDGSISFTSGSGSEITGTISVADGSYKVVFNSEERTAMVNTGFTGTWLVSGAYSTIEIGEIGPSMEATGTVSPNGEEEEVTFTYHAEGHYLTFMSGDTLYYINISNNRTEITVGTTNAFVGTVCIKSNLADSFYGVYQTENGGSIHFDGLGKSVYADGTAYTADVNGRILQRYYYNIDEAGVPALRRYNSYATRAQELFVAAADGNYSKDGEGTHYKIIIPDAAYNGAILSNSGVTYYFNGNGQVTRTQSNIPQTYSYTCTLGDTQLVVEIKISATERETVTITSNSAGTWTISSVETSGAAQA